MPLAEAEIAVWSLDLSAADASPTALSPDEQAHAAGYRCPRARHHFLQTRAALRHLLGDYLSLPPAQVTLASGRQGKPRLANVHARLHFNVSHSGDQAVLAFSHAPVGIDVEDEAAVRDWLELAPVACHPRELSGLLYQPDSVGRRRFLRLWTAKEAYAKARGQGLSLPLTAIRLDGAPGGWRPVVEPSWEDGLAWQIRALPAPTGYVASLATPLAQPRLTHQSFHPQSLSLARHLPPSKEIAPWNPSPACRSTRTPSVSTPFAARTSATWAATPI